MNSEKTLVFVAALKRGDISLLHEASELHDGIFCEERVLSVRQKAESRVASEFQCHRTVDRWSVLDLAIIQALEIANWKTIHKLFQFGYCNGFWIGLESALSVIVAVAEKNIASDLLSLIAWLLSKKLIMKKEDLDRLYRAAVLQEISDLLPLIMDQYDGKSSEGSGCLVPKDLTHASPELLGTVLSQGMIGVETIDIDGKTVLFYVETKPQIDLILRYDANFYHTADDGSTPLFDAVLNNDAKAKRLIDGYGMDLNQPNSLGQTVTDWLLLQVERNNTFTEIVRSFELLSDHGIPFTACMEADLRSGVLNKSLKLFELYITTSEPTEADTLSVDLIHFMANCDDSLELLRSLRSYCTENKSHGSTRKLNRLAPKVIEVFCTINGEESLFDRIRDKGELKWLLTAYPDTDLLALSSATSNESLSAYIFTLAMKRLA